MKRLLSFILIISILLSISINIFAAAEDGLDYNTAITITDFYDIPVVNCDDDAGLVYKFTAPATAAYTIVSISDYDIFGQLEDSDKNAIVWYGSRAGEDGDFELSANLTKGKTYYLWTDPDGVDTASYTMQISYEKTSGYYTYDAYTNNCIITAYSGNESSVTIPSSLGGMTVTGIARDVFYQNTALTTVSIPGTVEYIGSDCFYKCTSLKTLDLNNGLKSIGAAAFEGCTSLTYLHVPPTVEEILTDAFYGCTKLSQIDLCEGLEIIKSSAFEGCSSVTEIELPGTLRTLGSYAFSNCSSLNRVTIHEGLELVDRYAFRGCSKLPEIVFPESLTEIREYALRNCYALTDVTFLNPETVFASDDDIFYNCSGFTIHGAEGSTAQTYAETYSMAFEVIGEEEESGLIDPGFSSAVPIAESGSIVDLNINGAYQYYTFTQTTEDNFTAEVVSTSSVKIKYELYDSDFSLMEEFTAPANDSYSSGWYPLPQGTYYIKVYPVSGSIASGTLCINFAAGDTSAIFDPGFESAEPILDVKTSYKFSAEGTYCYFVFKPMEQLNVHLSLSNGSQGELAWELFDENYSLIYSYVMPRANGMLHTLQATPGVYYIRFFSTGDHAISGSLSINNDVPLANPKYIPLLDFQIEESSLELQVGDSYQLTPVFIPTDADYQTVFWQSDDSSVVEVSDNGIITAMKKGTATITGNVTETYDGKVATYSDTVSVVVGDNLELTDPGFESAERLYVSGERILFDMDGTSQYYIFSLIAGKSLNLFLDVALYDLVKMEMYDSSHQLLYSYKTQDGAPAVRAFISYVPEGTYYIKLSPLENAAVSGFLEITSIAIEPLITDPGFSSAFHITDKEISYDFEGLYEYKYFSFDMTETGVADIYIENLSEGHLEYELYQEEDTVLFRYDMSEGKAYTYSPELQAGRYYVRVYTPWNHAFSGRINIYSDVLGNGSTPDIPESDSESNAKLRVYEPTYEYIRQFKDNFTTVYNNGVYSIVDAQNNYHYSTTQDGFGDYSEDIVAVYDADKHEIIFTRLDGYSFVCAGYIWAGEFLGGKCVIVDEDGKYGLIDVSGNFILDCEYEDIEYDTSDTVLFRTDEGWTSYTIGQSTAYTLRSSIPALYNPVLSVTGEHIIASDGSAYGILTADNILLTEFKYDLIHDAAEGLFVGYRGDYVDLIETDGTVSATLEAYYVGGYSEGKLAVYDGTEFFYVDKNGNLAVELAAEDVVSTEEFHESYAVVRLADRGYTYINAYGEIAVDTYWDYAAQFAEGYALVMNYITDGDGNMLRRWNVIDTDFNNVLTLEDDVYIDAADEHSVDFSNGYIRTVDRNTGLMGFIQLDVSTSEYIAGDLNDDGTVSVEDVQYLLKYLTSSEEYPIRPAEVDYNGDDAVTCADALYLLRHTLLPKRYPLNR